MKSSFEDHPKESNPESIVTRAVSGEDGQLPPEAEPGIVPSNEALEFVEKHRDLLEHYARGKVKFAPAPEGLGTFAFDLEKDTIYIHPRFYKELGLSDEKTGFAAFHEIEHFLEKKAMLEEKGGERSFDGYLKRIKSSRAYGLMDNCVADVRENRSVVEKTNQGYRQLEESIYKEDLFKETDFTKEPKHVQFAEALLREARVPDEKCAIAPEVREKLDALKAMKTESGDNFFDLMTDPEVPMSTRLDLQNEHIWPIVEELLKKDIEEEKNKKEKEGKGDEKNNGGKNEGKPKDGKGDDSDAKDKEAGRKESEKAGKSGKESSGGGKIGKGTGREKAEKLDPNEIFGEAYERAEKRAPNAVPVEQIEKAFKEWKKAVKESPLDKADNEYAEKLGIKKEELQKYRQIVESLEKIVDPETGMSVVEELRELMNRIIAHRLKPAMSPRYPQEDGEDLVDPAGLVAEAKAGNLEPKVWETVEVKEKKGQRFGEVEISLVFDRSGSMDDDGGAKKVEQQRAAVMVMEALKEFADICEEERVNMEKPLEIRSEAYSFQSSSEDSRPIKSMSKELSEKERIQVAGKLSTTAGSTTDFVPLENIKAALDKDEEMKHKIMEGEVKKVVIIFTDGGSDDKARVKKAHEGLRSLGVVVACIAVTESGKPALDTYAPDARLAETAEKLPSVLTDILKEHLANI